MKKRFLLITQVFYPDEVSTANLFTNLCAVLAKDDCLQVDVWCAQPSYTTLKRQPRKVLYQKIAITYLNSTNFPKSKLIGRLLNYVTFMFSVAWKLIFSKDKPVVLTHTTPPSLGIMLSFICAMKKRKFVYILLDIFPDGLWRLGKVSRNNLFIRIWERLNYLALKKSSKIVVIGRDMNEWISAIYPAGLEKTEYIPLWQDENLIQPMEFLENKFVREHNLQDKFVVQYSGNMGLWNEMEPFAIAALREIEGVFFQFIGGGMRKKELIQVFSDKTMDHVMILPFQSNENFRTTLTACHVSLISLRRGLEGMAVPSKIYGIMAASIPVIAMVPENSEIAYIVKEENCGYVVDPGDIEGLIDAIHKMKDNEQMRRIMGENGRKAYEEKYTTEMIAQKYKNLILGI